MAATDRSHKEVSITESSPTIAKSMAATAKKLLESRSTTPSGSTDSSDRDGGEEDISRCYCLFIEEDVYVKSRIYDAEN